MADLDGMPATQAAELLTECCGSSRWVSAMMAQRPFGSRHAVNKAADESWRALAAGDWLEAFARHPRIGEQSGAIPQGERGSEWSAGEQSGVAGGRDTVREELAAANRDYERRFGYIYIVCATGRSAEELLGLARARLQNTPAAELRVAAREQRKITRIRLDNLLDKEEEQ